MRQLRDETRRVIELFTIFLGYPRRGNFKVSTIINSPKRIKENICEPVSRISLRFIMMMVVMVMDCLNLADGSDYDV